MWSVVALNAHELNAGLQRACFVHEHRVKTCCLRAKRRHTVSLASFQIQLSQEMTCRPCAGNNQAQVTIATKSENAQLDSELGKQKGRAHLPKVHQRKRHKHRPAEVAQFLNRYRPKPDET